MTRKRHELKRHNDDSLTAWTRDLLHGATPDSRSAAAASIGSCAQRGSRQALAVLEQALKQEQDPGVRASIVYYLGETGCPDAFSSLNYALNDPFWMVRAMAVNAAASCHGWVLRALYVGNNQLYEQVDSLTRNLLLRAAQDSDPSIRQLAARYLETFDN